MYSSTPQNLGNLNIHIYDKKTFAMNSIWSLKYSQGKEWREGKFTYNLENKHQILFEGIKGEGRGDIALDDISLSYVNCGFGPIEAQIKNATTSTIPTTTISVRPLSAFDCTFEADYCIWKQSNDSSFNWLRAQGLKGEISPGPIQYDHTFGTSNGWYIFANTKNAEAFGKADLETNQVFGVASGPQCMEFYYYLSTNNKFAFNIYRKYFVGNSGVTGIPIWSKGNSQGEFWKLGRVSLVTNDLSSFAVLLDLSIFENGTSTDKFAIDDIYFTPGLCKDGSEVNQLCTFQQDTCGYLIDTTLDFKWQLFIPNDNSLPGLPDHSTGSTGTGYLYALSTYAKTNDTATITSPVYSSLINRQDQCLEFYFYLVGQKAMRLDVSLLTMTSSNLLWQRDNQHIDFWWKGEVNIRSVTNYSIKFEAIAGTDPTDGLAALDDIILRDGKCSSLNDVCDFENDDLCNWVNLRENDFDWRINSGATPTLNTGPMFDHNLANINGHYIYIDASQPSLQGWKAQLISEPQLDQNTGCISFWYFMWGSVS